LRVLRVEDFTVEDLEFENFGSGTPTHGPGFEVLMFFCSSFSSAYFQELKFYGFHGLGFRVVLGTYSSLRGGRPCCCRIKHTGDLS